MVREIHFEIKYKYTDELLLRKRKPKEASATNTNHLHYIIFGRPKPHTRVSP